MLEYITFSPRLAEGQLQNELVRSTPSTRRPVLFTTPQGDVNASLAASAHSVYYGHVRKHYQDQLKGIVGHIWSQFSLPKDQLIVEMGSGPFGYYCEHIRPDGISENLWLQRELVPGFVDINHKIFPHRQIEQGSYYSISDINVPIITGLSSLDTPQFIGIAIDQIANALQSGGYFLHIQDVLPGERGVLYESYLRGQEPQVVFDHNIESSPTAPIGYDFGFGKIDIISLFAAVLQHCIEDHPALKLIEHGFYTHSSNELGHQSLRNNFIFSRENPSLKLDPVRELTALVTLAQKQ